MCKSGSEKKSVGGEAKKGKIVAKVLTAGDGGVGKTTLLTRLTEGRFLAKGKMTIGVDFFLKELEVDGSAFTFQMWDFGGQERFRTLIPAYTAGAKGALLMFDLTRPSSIKGVREWIELCRGGDPDIPILLVGTKLDLEEEVVVDDEIAQMIVDAFDLCGYIKVSSKTGENVLEAFETLGLKMDERIRAQLKDREGG